MTEAPMGPGIVVGMIAWRNCEAGTTNALWALARSYARITLILHEGDALVTRARSTVATKFLRDYPDADVLITIDSDIVFAPQSALQICQQAHDLGAIVCGAYPTRAWEKGNVASHLGDRVIEFNLDSTPQEIVWGASGFMAIPRVALERMRDELELPLLHKTKHVDLQYYPFYEAPRGVAPDDGEEIGMSEDFDFCAKAARLGIKTYVNPAVRLGHMGTQMFRLEHLVWKQPPSMPLKLTKQGIVEAGVPQGLEGYATGKAEPAPELWVPNRAERRRQQRETGFPSSKVPVRA